MNSHIPRRIIQTGKTSELSLLAQAAAVNVRLLNPDFEYVYFTDHQVEAFIDGLPEDPRCATSGVSRRTVLVPSPTLGSRWAASAWGFALTADCFDSEAFRAFYDEHYGLGPEDLCNPPAQALTANPCP